MMDMDNIKILVEENELSLNKDLDFLLGYDFTPIVTNRSSVDPNVTYKFKRWNKYDRCNTKYNCEIDGKNLSSFMTSDQKCGTHRVFLIIRKAPYTEPTCIRDISDTENSNKK